jgi:hypothetical protein
MTDQQQSHRDQRHHQHDQRHRQHQDHGQFGHPEVQRREFLWRERVKLELQVQALLVRAESLDQAWRALQQRKANLQHQKPKLAAQIVLSGLARGLCRLSGSSIMSGNASCRKRSGCGKRSSSARATWLRFKPRSRSFNSNSRCSNSAKQRHERVNRGVLCSVSTPSSPHQCDSPWPHPLSCSPRRMAKRVSLQLSSTMTEKPERSPCCYPFHLWVALAGLTLCKRLPTMLQYTRVGPSL